MRFSALPKQRPSLPGCIARCSLIRDFVVPAFMIMPQLLLMHTARVLCFGSMCECLLRSSLLRPRFSSSAVHNFQVTCRHRHVVHDRILPVCPVHSDRRNVPACCSVRGDTRGWEEAPFEPTAHLTRDFACIVILRLRGYPRLYPSGASATYQLINSPTINHLSPAHNECGLSACPQREA